MNKVNGYSVIFTADETRISYNLTEINEDGEVLRSNIRKSTVIKKDSTDILEAVEKVNKFLLEKESATV